MLKGMDLSKRFFSEILYPKIKKEFKIPVAVGLMGYGSECYGYDDHISVDHDFSAMPVILIRHEDYMEYGEKLKKILLELPEEYMGFRVLEESIWGKNRRGVLDIDEYIYKFLGSSCGPEKEENFRDIPQHLLSSFTNGEIFIDEIGVITKLREKLKFYPENIRLNMMATRCMSMNSAFVNYERCTMRSEEVASYKAIEIFMTSAMEMYFLIHKVYCPYYKWQHRMLREIDDFAFSSIEKLVKFDTTYLEKIDLMYAISNDIIEKLEKENIVVKTADFIGYYGPIIQNKIENKNIRDLGCWSD